MIGIRNPSFTDKDLESSAWNRNPRRGMQSPGLSCITLYGASKSYQISEKNLVVLKR